MTRLPSTMRSAVDETVTSHEKVHVVARIAENIRGLWQQAGSTDVLAAIEKHPTLLHEKSILLDLVLDDYKAKQESFSSLHLSKYCDQFQGLGDSIQHSIYRQLQVQQYIDENPELLALVQKIEWPSPRDLVQGYYILEELGRGGISHVYLCEQVELGSRQIVVKMSQEGSYEASVLGKLNHPNIVPIYSVTACKETGHSFLTMPFLGRSTLFDLVDHAFRESIPSVTKPIQEAGNLWRKPSDKESAERESQDSLFHGKEPYVQGILSIAVQLADALAFAHSRGVFHGDIKPSNVLITPQGEPILLDFNLAIDNESGFSPYGGTLPYMPPERLYSVAYPSSVENAKSFYDVRSEIFSLGAMLYHLLTGKPPFIPSEDILNVTQTAKQLLNQQRTGPPLPRSINPQIDRRIEKLVLQCLAWEPSQRFQTMEEVSRQLQQELRPIRLFQKRIKSRPILSSLLLSGSLAACCVAGYWGSTLPPYHIRQFEKGMQSQNAGRAREAIAYFDRSLQETPTFRKALFEKARTNLSLNNLDAAISDFSKLATEYKDAKSMDYTGYCFNLKGKPIVAIAWYEKAIKAGLETPALYNNLAASSLSNRSKLKSEQRLTLVEKHLLKAYQLNSHSATIRLNFIRLELIKTAIDPSYVPTPGLKHLQYLLLNEPKSAQLWVMASRYYAILAKTDTKWQKEGVSALKMAASLGAEGLVTSIEKKNIPKIYQSSPERNEILQLAKKNKSMKQILIPQYMEPLPEN